VQDALEPALAEVACAPVATTSAGRTDRGVHARGQVVHFDTTAQRPVSAWVRGVNAHLPDALAVLWAREVADEFHARYSARSRTYFYRLLNRAVRPGLEAHRIGWFHLPLDIDLMRAGAARLVGEHDFSAFRAAECQAKSAVRTVHELTVDRNGDEIHLRIRANAFLQHMVRNIVGALVYVGKGKHAPAWIGEVLASRDRSGAAPTFGPEGLYLEKVEYEAHWGLPQ
jgi:tRNA pseudouridine38-40 synthase